MSETRYIISDAAKMVDVEPHVLRYWEEELGMEIPRNEMGHRYYTDKEIKLFANVRDLKDKGFQLKAIKMILSTISEEVPMNNIISLDEVRKGYNEEDDVKAAKPDAAVKAEAGQASKTAEVSKPVDIDKIEKESAQLMKATEEAMPPVSSELEKITSEDKMKHFKYIMDGIVMQALKKNNEELEARLSDNITDKVIKEMDYLFRVQEEKEEQRYKEIDSIIRKKQKGRKQVAATQAPPYGPAKQKRGLFKSKNTF